MGLSSGKSSRFDAAGTVSEVPVEDRYAMLIDAVQDYAIFMLDTDGRVASWNSGAQRIKGYTRDEIIGRHFSAFYTPEDIAGGKPERELRTAAAVGRLEDEGWRVRRDGSRFWATVAISAVHDASGKLLGFAKVTRDSTERMRVAELERANEVSTQVQIARENEQKRIARELHDDLAQRLTALKMSVAVLDADLSAQAATAPLTAQTHELRLQIDWMTAALRRIAADLRPPLLDDLGLAAALDWMAEDFTKRYGVRASVELQPAEPELSEFAATTLFRIVQEALTNVARHAHADTVHVRMMCAGPSVSLEIDDDGIGVALERTADRTADKRSFGLLGIRERVRQLRGDVSFSSSPGRGFRISVRIPVDALR